MGSLLNRAKSRFLASGGPDIKEFFFCLEAKSGSDSAKWLRGLKIKIIKVTFDRAVKSGEQNDNSESARFPSLSLTHRGVPHSCRSACCSHICSEPNPITALP